MEDRGPQITLVIGVFVGLSWLFVSLRIVVRALITKTWKLDDSLLVLSLFLYTTYGAVGLQSVKWGVGRYLAQIPLEDVPKALHAWWFDEILYAVTTFFVRLSISVFLLRLATRRAHKYTIYATQLTISILTIAYTILLILQCSPSDFFWKQSQDVKGSCININLVTDASIAHSALGLVVDWTLGLLPVWIMWNANMGERVKLPVVGLLTLGLLAGIAALARIPFIKELSTTENFLYAATNVEIWSIIEPGLCIMAFSVSTLRPLLRVFFPRAFTSLVIPNQLSFGEDQPHEQLYDGTTDYMYSLNTLKTKESRASSLTSCTRSSYTQSSYTQSSSTRSSYDGLRKDKKFRSTISSSTTLVSPQESEEYEKDQIRNFSFKNDSISLKRMTETIYEISDDDDFTRTPTSSRSLTNSMTTIFPTDPPFLPTPVFSTSPSEFDWPLKDSSKTLF